jgi:hypothetical protein
MKKILITICIVVTRTVNVQAAQFMAGEHAPRTLVQRLDLWIQQNGKSWTNKLMIANMSRGVSVNGTADAVHHADIYVAKEIADLSEKRVFEDLRVHACCPEGWNYAFMVLCLLPQVAGMRNKESRFVRYTNGLVNAVRKRLVECCRQAAAQAKEDIEIYCDGFDISRFLSSGQLNVSSGPLNVENVKEKELLAAVSEDILGRPFGNTTSCLTFRADSSGHVTEDGQSSRRSPRCVGQWNPVSPQYASLHAYRSSEFDAFAAVVQAMSANKRLVWNFIAMYEDGDNGAGGLIGRLFRGERQGETTEVTECARSLGFRGRERVGHVLSEIERLVGAFVGIEIASYLSMMVAHQEYEPPETRKLRGCGIPEVLVCTQSQMQAVNQSLSMRDGKWIPGMVQDQFSLAYKGVSHGYELMAVIQEVGHGKDRFESWRRTEELPLVTYQREWGNAWRKYEGGIGSSTTEYEAFYGNGSTPLYFFFQRDVS